MAEAEHDIEKDGIVYQDEKDDLPSEIDPEATYEVTLKTAIPDYFGSPLAPNKSVTMIGSLVQKYREFIRVAKPAGSALSI